MTRPSNIGAGDPDTRWDRCAPYVVVVMLATLALGVAWSAHQSLALLSASIASLGGVQ